MPNWWSPAYIHLCDSVSPPSPQLVGTALAIHGAHTANACQNALPGSALTTFYSRRQAHRTHLQASKVAAWWASVWLRGHERAGLVREPRTAEAIKAVQSFLAISKSLKPAILTRMREVRQLVGHYLSDKRNVIVLKRAIGRRLT